MQASNMVIRSTHESQCGCTMLSARRRRVTHPKHGQQDGGGLRRVLAIAQGSNRCGPPHAALQPFVQTSVMRQTGLNTSCKQVQHGTWGAFPLPKTGRCTSNRHPGECWSATLLPSLASSATMLKRPLRLACAWGCAAEPPPSLPSSDTIDSVRITGSPRSLFDSIESAGSRGLQIVQDTPSDPSGRNAEVVWLLQNRLCSLVQQPGAAATQNIRPCVAGGGNAPLLGRPRRGLHPD